MQQTNKTNKTQQTTIFSAKNRLSFSEPKGKSVLDKKFWKSSSRQAEKDATKQKVLSFQEVGQKRKTVIKNNLSLASFTLQTAKFFSLKRLF